MGVELEYLPVTKTLKDTKNWYKKYKLGKFALIKEVYLLPMPQLRVGSPAEKVKFYQQWAIKNLLYQNHIISQAKYEKIGFYLIKYKFNISIIFTLF
jgi:hypothetical protein